MKYPSDATNVKPLTIPKPDWICGIQLEQMPPDVYASLYPNQPPSPKLSIPVSELNLVFTKASQFQDLCAGIGQSFALPQIIVERNSMAGGSLFSCQNQLFGGLRCIISAMRLLKENVSAELEIVALGMCNVGNYIELWAMTEIDNKVHSPFANQSNSQGRVMARYLKGFNLLERQDLAHFCSLCIRIGCRVQQYYADVLTALASVSAMRVNISRNNRTPTSSSAVRRNHGSSPQKSRTDTRNSLEGQYMDFSSWEEEMMDHLSVMNQANEGERHTVNSWILYWLNRINSERPGTFPQVPPFRRWFVDRQAICNHAIRIKLPTIDITSYAEAVGETTVVEKDDEDDECLRLEDRVTET